MSLMYYVVLFIQHPNNKVMNVYWRGLCLEDLHPGKFCRPPWPLTMTQATLVAPLAILVILFVPTILYVLVLSTCNSKKGMMVTDHAILVIFPIFTNLYYTFESEVRVDTRPTISVVDCQAQTRCQAGSSCQARAGCQAGARSHSYPNISTSAQKGFQKKRFKTFIFKTWAWKGTFMFVRWKDISLR